MSTPNRPMPTPVRDPGFRRPTGQLLTRAGVDPTVAARYSGVLPDSTDPADVVRALRHQAASDDALAWRHRAAALEARAIARRVEERSRSGPSAGGRAARAR
ncbi:hypothetical protein GCM10022238_09610 [Gordonia hankookensis]